jgi:hypothetical protein
LEESGFCGDTTSSPLPSGSGGGAVADVGGGGSEALAPDTSNGGLSSLINFPNIFMVPNSIHGWPRCHSS